MLVSGRLCLLPFFASVSGLSSHGPQAKVDPPLFSVQTQKVIYIGRASPLPSQQHRPSATLYSPTASASSVLQLHLRLQRLDFASAFASLRLACISLTRHQLINHQSPYLHRRNVAACSPNPLNKKSSGPFLPPLPWHPQPCTRKKPRSSLRVLFLSPQKSYIALAWRPLEPKVA